MAESKQSIIEVNLPALKQRTDSLIRGAGSFAYKTVKLPQAFMPVAQLLLNDENIERDELSRELDELFEQLYAHPISGHVRSVTGYLRKYKVIPNEQTTENLIRFLVNQVTLRSPVQIPEPLISEFWDFFNELFSAPELKGLFELNLDIVRTIIGTYEPSIVEVVNLIKDTRRVNRRAVTDARLKFQMVRSDLVILRRQIRAIRYIKPFFQTDPKDFHAQAEIVASMVREFGPLFIKLAQVAAANADFLPEEIATELKVFQQDVEPMTADEVIAAFQESMGKPPEECFFGLDVHKPLKSGSIGSVFVAKKPTIENGVEVLIPVIVKVGRHNLEREFAMGVMALDLMIMSSQYWAPHSKLVPFLRALSDQVKEFAKGFQQELDFEDEALRQTRFVERCADSRVWSVPRIYAASSRILVMEYLEDAVPLDAMLKENHNDPRRERNGLLKNKAFPRRVGDNFIYTLMEHIIIYRELHGDLHPGNVMVDADAKIYLIDWGNSVELREKWYLVWEYVAGAFLADTDRMAKAVIAMSTQPDAESERREEVLAALRETLRRKGITPLTHKPLKILLDEGWDGIHKRLQSIVHLMSNTQQLGLVIRSDYLHLSRSLVAMAGTYGHLYSDLPRHQMIYDLLSSTALFPYRYLFERLQARRRDVQRFLLG